MEGRRRGRGRAVNVQSNTDFQLGFVRCQALHRLMIERLFRELTMTVDENRWCLLFVVRFAMFVFVGSLLPPWKQDWLKIKLEADITAET